MKKYVKLFVAAAVLLCGMIFTGCKDLREALKGPRDTWYWKQVSYTNKNNQETALNVYLCFSEDGFNSGVKDIEPGFTVVITAYTDANDVIDGLTNRKYIMKTFSTTGETSIAATADDGEDTSGYKFTMSGTKWDVIYNTIEMTKEEGVITPFRGDISYSPLTSLEDFSWKRLLVESLLGNLLDY